MIVCARFRSERNLDFAFTPLLSKSLSSFAVTALGEESLHNSALHLFSFLDLPPPLPPFRAAEDGRFTVKLDNFASHDILKCQRSVDTAYILAIWFPWMFTLGHTLLLHPSVVVVIIIILL